MTNQNTKDYDDENYIEDDNHYDNTKMIMMTWMI